MVSFSSFFEKEMKIFYAESLCQKSGAFSLFHSPCGGRGILFLHANKGRKRETVLDAFEISCTLPRWRAGPCLVYRLPYPTFCLSRDLVKRFFFLCLSRRGPFSECLRGGIGYSVRILEKKAPFSRWKECCELLRAWSILWVLSLDTSVAAPGINCSSFWATFLRWN